MIFIGIAIGFYGYVFPGNINLMVLDLYSSKKYRLLVWVLSLIIIFESIYCVLSLHFLQSLHSNSAMYRLIELFSYLLILLMGIWMIFENRKNTKFAHSNTLIRGILSIIIHPQQIPFWVIMGVVLNQQFDFSVYHLDFVSFVIFNAVGTLLAMLLYMFFGNYLLQYRKLNIAQINKMIGGIYLLFAIYHFFLKLTF